MMVLVAGTVLCTKGSLKGVTMWTSVVMQDCAKLYEEPGGPNTCPMCRAKIQQVHFRAKGLQSAILIASKLVASSAHQLSARCAAGCS